MISRRKALRAGAGLAAIGALGAPAIAHAQTKMPKITVKEVPNVADVYPYAVSDKIVGVSIFTSAIGLGFRTDKGLTKPTSWKDLADPKLAGVRGGYIIPVNSLGQCHLMMLGKIYGKGLTDLDTAYT